MVGRQFVALLTTVQFCPVTPLKNTGEELLLLHKKYKEYFLAGGAAMNILNALWWIVDPERFTEMFECSTVYGVLLLFEAFIVLPAVLFVADKVFDKLHEKLKKYLVINGK